jgi:hypothetical protein
VKIRGNAKEKWQKIKKEIRGFEKSHRENMGGKLGPGAQERRK